MLDPRGPLPEAVYWRRRAMALSVAVLALLLAIWAATTLAGGDQPTSAQPAAAASAPNSEPASASASAPPSSASAEPSASVSSSTSSPPPQPPQPCPDEVIELVAQPSHPQYRVGVQPEFRLVVGNTGERACIRDLDAAMQELLLFTQDGRTRLWGSNDCFSGRSEAVRTLAAGERMIFSLVWSGLGSQPGCPEGREQLPPGDYQLVARLGPLTSTPTPVRLVP